MKRKISRSLKQTFANKEHTQKEIVYFLSYPRNEEHKNHITGEVHVQNIGVLFYSIAYQYEGKYKVSYFIFYTHLLNSV